MIMAMEYSSFLRLFLFTVLFTISVSSSTTPPSYTDRCALIVPESTSTDPDYSLPHLLRITNGRYTGGDKILVNSSSDQFSFDYEKYLSFRTRKVYKTKSSGVYKIEGYLIFSKYGQSSLKFVLNGFWSESSGKLCMVGSASRHSREGNSLKLDALLKLNFAQNATISTSLVGGTLESLSSSDDSNYFEPISILAFPSMSSYNYTLVSEEFNSGCPGGTDIPPNLSLVLPRGSICSMLSRQFGTFKLEYASDCNSSQNCTPFGKDIGYLPPFMSLSEIQCSEDVQKLRYLVEFSNSSYGGYYYQPFNPNTTLIAEGSWDGKKNRLCIVACRILNPSDSMGDAHVGNCSTRLSLRFPAVWSIKQRGIVGEIWSNRTENVSGYFHRIRLEGSSYNMLGVPGLEYNYTEMDRVKKLCPEKKPLKNKGLRYPTANSYDMRFYLSGKGSKGRTAWGSAEPISVGDEFNEQGSVRIFHSSSMLDESSTVKKETNNSSPLNITYNVRFTPLGDPSSDGEVEISAEGIYDEETGHLCMVGCKKLGSYIQKSTNDSMDDCEVLLKFQFPPLNAKKRGVIKGSIESTRKHSDTLFFEHLNFSATAYYTSEAERSIWRMDLEIAMALISNTLACVFVGLQLMYVKKHPNVLPFTSLVMLVILTLGYMIPLLLNFEALFLENHNKQRNVFLRAGGWLEVNEVTVRVITMVAFVLQFRLLQQAWSARSGDGNQKGLWVAEMKALFVTVAFYISGVFMVVLVNWMKNNNGNTMVMSSRSVAYQQNHLWGDLRSYAGLVIDGFLFPQILLNIFQISRENALSRLFYIGTTFVRLVPHAYDLYRAHIVSQDFNEPYIYASPTADFYSTAWDVIIPCGSLFFAVIIFLQQRFGGRCILPRRFRELELYEKVPVVSS